MQNENQDSIFGPQDVISTYTDSQAIEDGILVALNPGDRVTRSVWEWLVEKQPKGSAPPNNWPVEMMGWFRACAIPKVEALELLAQFGKDEAQRRYERLVRDRKALAMARGVIEQNRSRAQRTYDDNTDGGFLKLFAREHDGIIVEIVATAASATKTLWLLPNENQGMTLMFPEDY